MRARGNQGGESDGSSMQVSSAERHQQMEPPLAHDLINKLSVIVGYCDLLVEKTPDDPSVQRQAQLIRSTARSMAADLARFQCDLVRLRTGNAQKAG